MSAAPDISNVIAARNRQAVFGVLVLLLLASVYSCTLGAVPGAWLVLFGGCVLAAASLLAWYRNTVSEDASLVATTLLVTTLVVPFFLTRNWYTWAVGALGFSILEVARFFLSSKSASDNEGPTINRFNRPGDEAQLAQQRRVATGFRLGDARLDAKVEKALRELEWNATNPYPGARPFDATPFLQLIHSIPVHHRGSLVLRELNFHDTGSTFYELADEHDSLIRVAAINAILELYYTQIQLAYDSSGDTALDFEELKARSRKFWQQDVYWERQAAG